MKAWLLNGLMVDLMNCSPAERSGTAFKNTECRHVRLAALRIMTTLAARQKTGAEVVGFWEWAPKAQMVREDDSTTESRRLIRVADEYLCKLPTRADDVTEQAASAAAPYGRFWHTTDFVCHPHSVAIGG
jgi:hypothetical protein